MKQILIADSGGTKTDWCLISNQNEEEFFSTESYHPVNWSDDFDDRIKAYWTGKGNLKEIDLYFFGAGCLNIDKADEFKNKLLGLGFQSVIIKSDLHGAGYALLGNKKGTVAIMGTGSVVFDWQNNQAINIVGGKGHEYGDEGSGFYFGKLVYQAFLENELTAIQRNVFEKLVDVKSLSFPKDNKFSLATIAFLLKDYKDLFKIFHRKNIQAFYKEHFPDKRNFELSTVGSYAYHHQELISQELGYYQIEINSSINKPIVLLVEQMASFID